MTKENQIDDLSRMRQANAKVILGVVVEEFDGDMSEWVRSNAVGLWDYCQVTINGESQSFGVSGGGVVSVNRHPFDPNGIINDNADSIRAAIIKSFGLDDEMSLSI